MWMATALVIGNMIGSGVFLLPSSLASYGPISLIAFAFTAVGAILLAFVFARLGRAYPQTGGPYAYSRRAFGEFIGFQMAWGYWIAIWAGNAAIAIAFVGYLAHFWGGATASTFGSALIAMAAIWVLTLVNLAGVRQSGMVQLVTTVLKFVPLVAFAMVGVFFIKSDNLTPFNASSDSFFGAITAAAALTLWSFIGLESATVPAEDVENPKRTIPRATIIGTTVTSLLYIVATLAVFGAVPAASLANSTAPFADAANVIVGGTWSGHVIAFAALVATFGCLNGWILLQAQIPMAAARDKLFPRQFGLLSGNGTPWFGLVVSSVLVTGLMAMNYTRGLVDQFTFVILLATLTTLVPYAYSAMAQVMLFVTDRASFEGARFARDTLIAVLAFTYSMWAIWGAGADVVLKGFVLLMSGIPIYVWMKWRTSGPEAVEPAQGGITVESIKVVSIDEPLASSSAAPSSSGVHAGSQRSRAPQVVQGMR
jgi:APA family basic amino acid/polyamine antiporter